MCITNVSQVIQGSNHPYFTIKLKIVVDEYITVRLMLKNSSGVTTDIFRAKKANLVPVTFKKISTTSNGIKFYNLYRSSLMEDAPCNITIEMDEDPWLDIRDSKNKEQIEYIVTGCIRWIGEGIKKSIPNSPVTRTIEDGILMEITGNMPLTVWGSNISTITENRWYQITDIVIRKYYGTKLSTASMSIFEEMENESTIDCSYYLDHEKLE